MEELELCPFCKGKAHIIPCDDEGNLHYEDGYEQNPYSGIGYLLVHDSDENPDCPIAHEPGDNFYGGGKIYETPEQAAAAWNRRADTVKHSGDDSSFFKTVGLIKQIYAKYPVGGALHIVLDDDNVSDEDICWCMIHEIPKVTPEDLPLFEKCATNLIMLKTEQRRNECIKKAMNEDD